MTEEIINLKDYFVHHYDDWGRLYCVEFKGSPLELENSIKRLEQENKILKSNTNVLNDYILKNEQLKTNIDSLVKINESLKQENNAYKQSEQEAIEIIKELKEYSQRMENQRENYYKEYNNYRSALEEIREIAKFNQFYNPEYLLINGDIGQIQDLKMTEIYNKINEVLGNESN